MSDTKFTKGPWVATLDEDGYEASVVTSCGIEWDIATVICDPGYNSTGGDVEAINNAHLIAAAPDLYDACAEFIRKCDSGTARSTASYKQMTYALAKARGEK